MKDKNMINEDLVWVFDTGDEVPSGPYSTETAALNDIKVMTARNCAGEQIECGEPYQIERSVLKDLVKKYLDENELDESMNDDQKKEFYVRLKTEKVHFQYIENKNGQMRKAYGTLIPEELPPPKAKTDTKQQARDKLEKDVKKKRTFPTDSVFYYDLGPEPEHIGFRSFKMKNFDKYLD